RESTPSSQFFPSTTLFRSKRYKIERGRLPVRRQIHLGQERQRAPLLVRPHKELRVQPRNNLLDLQHGLRVQHTALPEVLLAVQCQVVAVQLEAPAAVAVVLEAVEQDNFFNRYHMNMM